VTMTKAEQPEVPIEAQKRWLKQAADGGDVVPPPGYKAMCESLFASLLRLQRIEAGLREPSNETLGKMMDAWNNEFGTPYTRYAKMLNAALDAILLRGKP